MKKITSLALALALALTLTACGKKDNTAGNGDSSVPADATALLTAVWDAHSDDEKFPAAGGDYENPVEDAPGAVSDMRPERMLSCGQTCQRSGPSSFS